MGGKEDAKAYENYKIMMEKFDQIGVKIQIQ